MESRKSGEAHRILTRENSGRDMLIREDPATGDDQRK
jgi:hypothetical protein